jgi:hypothetical protein
MTNITIIISMAVLSAAAGGTLPGSHLLNKKGDKDEHGRDKGGIMPVNLTFVPEMFFSAVIGFCSVTGIEYIAHALGYSLNFVTLFLLWSILSGWSYGWMQTGHAAMLPWDKIDKLLTNYRDNTLTPFVQWLCGSFGIRYKLSSGIYTEAYAWMFAAIKGFLIALPVGGLVGAVLWPVGYEIGSHAKNHLEKLFNHPMHIVSESASGAGMGVACVVWLDLCAFISGIV